jgi:acyl phosphate:glycerol-3-phosphate acyltransferase
MGVLTLKLLSAYALGALVGALIIGRFTGVDIRTQGSGNAGGTNALRTQGKWFALGVMVIDVGKGVLVTAWLAHTAVFGQAAPSELSLPWQSGLLALAVIVGHIYPVFFGMRGGKGAATLIGALAGANWLALAPVLLVWWCVVLLSGFVGLATILAALSLLLIPLLPPSLGIALPWSVETTCVIVALIVFAHRGNLWRMLQGTENRARSVWLLKPRH